MSVTICELCGGTEFKKEGDEFVCQQCGCGYSLEDARRLVHDDAPFGQDVQRPRRPMHGGRPGAGVDPRAGQPGVAELLGGIADVASTVATGMTAAARVALASLATPYDLNNSACEAMQKAARFFNQERHPEAMHMRALAEDAAACFTALDRAASLDLGAHAQNILIFENCKEIKDWLDNCHYYKPGNDGEERRETFRSAGKSAFPMPIDLNASTHIGATRDWHDVNWDDRAEADRDFLRNEYLNAHPENMQRKDELAARIAVAEADLGELKAEKKGKGFFSFSEKREVKERMEPVKELLSDLRSQVREIDQMADNYIDAKVDEVAASGFTRLNL